uniref:Uncharacterized protein n=1 Tax=Glossina pallidipes TaxID=7398 RepID=A0A1B0AG28_GLOPL
MGKIPPDELIDRYSKKVTLSPLTIMDGRCKAKNEFMNQVQCKRNLIIFDHIVGKKQRIKKEIIKRKRFILTTSFFVGIVAGWCTGGLMALMVCVGGGKISAGCLT